MSYVGPAVNFDLIRRCVVCGCVLLRSRPIDVCFGSDCKRKWLEFEQNKLKNDLKEWQRERDLAS